MSSSKTDADDTIPCPPPSAPMDDTLVTPHWRFHDAVVDFEVTAPPPSGVLVFDVEAFVEDEEQ
jgi:hypothetical protein